MGYFTLRSSRYWAAGGGEMIGHTFEIEDGKQHRLLVEDAPGDHQDSSSDEERHIRQLVEDAPGVVNQSTHWTCIICGTIAIPATDTACPDCGSTAAQAAESAPKVGASKGGKKLQLLDKTLDRLLAISPAAVDPPASVGPADAERGSSSAAEPLPPTAPAPAPAPTEPPVRTGFGCFHPLEEIGIYRPDERYVATLSSRTKDGGQTIDRSFCGFKGVLEQRGGTVQGAMGFNETLVAGLDNKLIQTGSMMMRSR